MTVSYQYKVASSTSGGFTRLLFMWRGGLFKLIYRELLIFIIAFDILSMVYRHLFTNDQKKIFEEIVIYCDTVIELIPLTFILGFYVAYVASRWWQQYQAIPWPDKCMHTIALYIPGKDEHTRLIRRTLMRYLNLTMVLILRCISSAVKKRFPTLDHLTEVGFMTQTEKQMFLSIPNCDFNTYWVPCAWFIHVLQDTKVENPNIDPIGVKLIMEQFNEFRAKCGLLWSYDWISIPLVYTQVVTLATYSFFLVAIVGRQYIEHSPKKTQMKIDVYLPVFTILQFFFFMGLLKVAEQLINPFGDDDEDFELNWLIDRHTKVAYLGVDTLMMQCPPLSKDIYYDNADLILPYTGASVIHKKKTYRGSVHFLQVPEDQQDMYLPEIVEEEGDDEDAASQKPSRRMSLFPHLFRRKSSSDQNISDKEEETRRSDMFVQFHHQWCSLAACICCHGTPRNDVLHSNDGIGRGKYTCTSPTFTRRSEGTNENHISAISSKESNPDTSPRRPVTKHNSMVYTPGSRKPKWVSIRDRRRKSVPILITGRKNSVMFHNDSKRSSSRRQSLDRLHKGITWKPFPNPRNEESIEASWARHTSNSNNTPGSDFTYVNPAYENSPKEGRRNVNPSLKDSGSAESGEQEVKPSVNQDCDNNRRISNNIRRTSTPLSIGKDVVLNLPSHDSLV